MVEETARQYELKIISRIAGALGEGDTAFASGMPAGLAEDRAAYWWVKHSKTTSND